MTELPQVPQTRCIYLQSKAMAVHGEGFEGDADYQDGLTDFWCVQTARGLGPDGGGVSLKECCDAQRDCHREY
ncbi:MAG TPA: hypothetical protein VKE74_31605 [Gemmataceae bacterium]|nr:hypothetical protein [Gemmataceae bacterium]